MHSNGPFTIDRENVEPDGCISIRDADGNVVAHDVPLEEDASLFAAAPLMLEALKGIASTFPGKQPDDICTDKDCHMCAVIAAIAAASVGQRGGTRRMSKRRRLESEGWKFTEPFQGKYEGKSFWFVRAKNGGVSVVAKDGRSGQHAMRKLLYQMAKDRNRLSLLLADFGAAAKEEGRT